MIEDDLLGLEIVKWFSHFRWRRQVSKTIQVVAQSQCSESKERIKWSDEFVLASDILMLPSTLLTSRTALSPYLIVRDLMLTIGC